MRECRRMARRGGKRGKKRGEKRRREKRVERGGTRGWQDDGIVGSRGAGAMHPKLGTVLSAILDLKDKNQIAFWGCLRSSQASTI